MAGVQRLILGIGHQQRFKGNTGACFNMPVQPLRERIVVQMQDLNLSQIHLFAGLYLIASVDKQQGAIAQDQGVARRAVKAGQPGENIVMRVAIFALKGIGTRNDNAIQRLGFQPLAQGRERGCGLHNFPFL